MTEVPCNGCTACCVGLTVHLDPDEVERFPAAIESRRIDLAGEYVGPAWFLPQDETGRCVYSIAGGCKVHEHKPRVCAEFDCLKWLDLILEADARPHMQERRRVAEERATR